MGVVAPGGPGRGGGDLLVSDEEMEAAGKFFSFCWKDMVAFETKQDSLLTNYY